MASSCRGSSTIQVALSWAIGAALRGACEMCSNGKHQLPDDPMKLVMAEIAVVQVAERLLAEHWTKVSCARAAIVCVCHLC